MISTRLPTAMVRSRRRVVYSYSEWLEASDNQSPVVNALPSKLIADFYAATPWIESVTVAPLSQLSIQPEAASSTGTMAGGRPDQQIKPGQEWFWTEAWQSAEQQAEADLKAGRFETFDSMEEFLAALG